MDSHSVLNRSGIENVSDIALVRIYLGKTDTLLYRQTVSVKWFEIISNVGGLCGLVSGFSLISLAELLYFVVRIVLGKFCPAMRSKSGPKKKEQHQQQQPFEANAVDSNEPPVILYILP